MIREALRKLMEQVPLTREEARQVMTSIMEGQATPAQIGALLVALRMKGEEPEEVAGFAAAMREKATPVLCPEPERTVDIVGTGGDGKHTINISTLAALVVAGAGVPVAKHGNRSVSSKCGSADVLQALGVNLDLDARQLSRCLEAVGMAFLFAPKLHPAMKHAIGPRRELGVRTVFNILGPITNPAGVRRQLIGVFSRDLARLLARVLQQLGATHILLVHSDDGLDEISLAAPTYVVELKKGDIREYCIDARSFGLSPQPDGITGGDAETNAAVARRILEGEAHPAREVVIANAAAGLYVAGVAGDFYEGARMAAESLDARAALACLEKLREFTRKCGEINAA